MYDFFQQYFIDPIVTQGVAGYNIFNTPVYALGFAIAAFAAYKLLKRLRVKIDRSFLIGILPFILAGGVWRVVRDARLVETPLLVTPLIYFSLFVAAVSTLLISVGVERLIKARERRADSVPKSYYKIWFVLGMVVLLSGFVLLARLPVQNWDALGIIAALGVGWAVVIFTANKLSSSFRGKALAERKGASLLPLRKVLSIFTRENSGILWVHMFDATTTFTALQFFAQSGYYEQHVLSGAVINALGPVGQFALKLVVLIPVLWLLDRELPRKQDAQLRGFLKIAILILGLALGVRNGLRLGFGI